MKTVMHPAGQAASLQHVVKPMVLELGEDEDQLSKALLLHEGTEMLHCSAGYG